MKEFPQVTAAVLTRGMVPITPQATKRRESLMKGVLAGHPSGDARVVALGAWTTETKFETFSCPVEQKSPQSRRASPSPANGAWQAYDAVKSRCSLL